MKRKKQNKSAAAKRNRRTHKSRRHASSMKRRKGTSRAKRSKRLAHPRKPHIRRPTTARRYYAMSPKEQETWDSLAHVISRIREGVPLAKASKEFGIPPRTVVELGRPALRKKNRRYVATKTDRLLRVVAILGSTGKYEIATRDSRQASLIGSHWAAVQRYLQTGDDTALLKFKHKRVLDANGRRHRFLTNLEELDRLASAGVLSFESIYAGGLR